MMLAAVLEPTCLTDKPSLMLNILLLDPEVLSCLVLFLELETYPHTPEILKREISLVPTG